MKLQEDTSIFEFDPAGAAEVARLRLLDVVVWLKFPSRRFAAAGAGAPVFLTDGLIGPTARRFVRSGKDSGRQQGEAAHDGGKVFQIDLGLATHHADHAHHAATHVVGLRVEGMLDANTHCRFGCCT